MIPRQATLQRALSQLGRGEEDSLSRSDLDRELPLRLACRECRMHGRACLSSTVSCLPHDLNSSRFPRERHSVDLELKKGLTWGLPFNKVERVLSDCASYFSPQSRHESCSA